MKTSSKIEFERYLLVLRFLRHVVSDDPARQSKRANLIMKYQPIYEQGVSMGDGEVSGDSILVGDGIVMGDSAVQACSSIAMQRGD